MALWKAKWSPLWIAVPLGGLVLALYVILPEQRGFYGLMLALCGVMIASQLAMLVMNRAFPPEVPDYAVKDLLDRVNDSLEDWLLIEFEPSLTLDEARARVGSDTYDQEHRKKSFLTKFKYVSGTPGIAFFFSSDKGYLLANRHATLALLKQYGSWTLDTWRSLQGAAMKLGLRAHSLDGPQTVRIIH